MLGLEYNFSLARYEPDELLIRGSRKFPNLCSSSAGWRSATVSTAAGSSTTVVR
jgi:hypothetical protein